MSFNDQLGGSRGGNVRSPPSAYQPRPQQSNYQANNSSYGNSNNYNSSYGKNSPYDNNSYGNSRGGNEYDQLIKVVSENIRQLSMNVGQIKQLSETLGTSRDSLENRENLRHLVETSKHISNDTIQSMKSVHDIKSSGPTEDKTRKTQQQKLMKDFQGALGKFQEISKYALDKEKSTPLPQRSSKHQSAHYEDDNEIDFEKQGLIDAQRSQQLQIENERQFMDALIADREQGIKEIEKTVVEVNEIFRDLAHLVSEQGVMIDNIESNIEESVVRTTEGVEELRKANEYQKSSRNKMCCLALIVMIIAAIVVLVIYFAVAK